MYAREAPLPVCTLLGHVWNCFDTYWFVMCIDVDALRN